ncbi:MAG: hypothetical protein C0617_07180 [Desulfuromonas sp.]|nr:hypothetical protein [Desulfuromonas sp.]PLX84614.1 MAG: hypothetical protein C0617_07180 [Desulfuromonas sp.]
MRDFALLLFLLGHGRDAEVKSAARQTLAEIPANELIPVVEDPGVHPQLLDFLAKVRLGDGALMARVLSSPVLERGTLLRVAAAAPAQVLSLVVGSGRFDKGDRELTEALLGNAQAAPDLKAQLQGPPEEAPPGPEASDGEESGEEFFDEGEELNLSKYQLSLEMEVAEKIKVAMTGDKEWRSIFLKDTNKLVCTAALKNPRITEGEVLTLVKNKSSQEELIRLIALNREWVKNREIKKALVMHPRTPPPKALRFMDALTDRDLKNMVRSRSVAQVLVNNARRLLTAKESRR